MSIEGEQKMDNEKVKELLNAGMKGRLPEMFGMEIVSAEYGAIDARMDLKPEHLAPNDFIHAATVVALADTAAGMGCIATLPDLSAGFTTIELKLNFLRTTKSGALTCQARMKHGGRRTQVWDSEVFREEDGKKLAMFRCTQMLLDTEDPRTKREEERRKAADGE